MFLELLCYSEKQRQLCMKRDHDAGVILIDGTDKPLLWTETISDSPGPRMFGADFETPGPDAVTLKSHWDDAVIIHAGTGRGYKHLLNGINEVTKWGKDWCDKHHVDPTPDALRAAAEVPRRVMSPLRLKTL